MINERELWGDFPDNGCIEHGTVGWEDGEEHFTRKGGEPVLVKVTLFRGRNVDDGGNQTGSKRGRGHKVECVIGAPLNEIPPDGSRVYVAYPAGAGWGQGMGAIFTRVVAEPDEQFSVNRAKMDFGPNVDLVIKARSITLSDYNDRYICTGPDTGIRFGDADGNYGSLDAGAWSFIIVNSTTLDGKAVFTMSEDDVRLMHKTAVTDKIAALKLKGGVANVMGDSFNAICANGSLGAAASPVAGIQYGPGVGVPSTSWFIQS